MPHNNKLKMCIRLNANVHDHPKIYYDKLKKRKWLRIKKMLPRRSSEYGSLLIAKQTLRYFYGNFSEKQFISIYKKAKVLKGNTGLNLIKLLERRLDTVLFRMRFGNTFNEVRQLISHKHIQVNGNVVTSSAFLINPGDDISTNENSYDHVSKSVHNAFKTSLNLKEEPLNFLSRHNLIDILKTRKLMFTPNYIEINYNLLKGSFLYSPSIDEVVYPSPINLLQITQYYEHKLKI